MTLARLWHAGGLVATAGTAWNFLVSSANLWYPAIAVASGPLAEHLPSLPPNALQSVFLVGTIVYLATLGDRFFDKIHGGS